MNSHWLIFGSKIFRLTYYLLPIDCISLCTVQKTKMELWRQCAAWLIDCRVLPDNHRVTWESAQVRWPSHSVAHLQTSKPPPPAAPSNFVRVVSGLRSGSGPQRWRAALPAAQQPAAAGRQPERDQPAPADVPGSTCAWRNPFQSVSIVTRRRR